MTYKDLEIGKIYTHPFLLGGSKNVKVIMLYEGKVTEFKHFIDANNKYRYHSCVSHKDAFFREPTEEERNFLISEIKRNMKANYLKVMKYFEPENVDTFPIY